ncbi:MAG: fused MFS/spermidine synthase [Desulfovibrio sp.]|nr:fused MFS/spermidine synthase [Desulfovibrio sp.]
MLETTVFICGALVMILEMVGGRMLAPHVGTSAIVWTSVIGIVLAFLALGAWAGGVFADKKLSLKGLAEALTGAAAGSAITAFFHASMGAAIAGGIDNLYAAAVASAIAVFALPAFFFGMITPYVIRLRIASIDTAGATVGRLYALSTAGSIIGSFLGGFVLISLFASAAIVWGIAFVLLILSLLVSPKKFWLRLVLLAVFVFLAWQDMAYSQWRKEKYGEEIIESPYNVIRLMNGRDSSRGGAAIRLMATDPGYSQSGMLIDDPAEPYFDYTRYYALGPKYAPRAKKILMLGGGGYSVPKWLLSGKSGIDPDFSLKVVEIDPAMTKTAREHFALKDDPRMEIEHRDARQFLNRQRDQYDLIFVDVFNSHYSIPFQMGTAEAIRELRRAAAPGGVLVMNMISAITGENGRLFRSVWQNLKKAFPDIDVYCVGYPNQPDKVQNLIILARDPLKPEASSPAIVPVSPDAKEIERMERRRYEGDIPEDTPPLTDEFAPVDRYTLMLTDK